MHYELIINNTRMTFYYYYLTIDLFLNNFT